MNLGYRKLKFFVGLNIWGFGLLCLLDELQHAKSSTWIVSISLLLVGSFLLMEGLISDGASKKPSNNDDEHP